MRGILPALAVLILAPATAGAADPEAGAAKAASMCAVCHGRTGIGIAPNFPNLAGQKELYLAKAMQDYRSGDRVDEQMSIIAQGLSDEDIANLAAFYASLPPSGE